jgi:hypothetical protein
MCGVESDERGVNSLKFGVNSLKFGVNSLKFGVNSFQCGVKTCRCAVKFSECRVEVGECEDIFIGDSLFFVSEWQKLARAATGLGACEPGFKDPATIFPVAER